VLRPARDVPLDEVGEVGCIAECLELEVQTTRSFCNAQAFGILVMAQD
jgi:hypothetical protein